MNTKADARARIEAIGDDLVEVSHAIHARPETAYRESFASGLLADRLERAGFAVERAPGGLETAFVATAGDGPLHVAFCAEYDALPGIGHACGHNMIAAMALGAGIAAASLAADAGLSIRVIGTPAEEGGGGKIALLEAGAFAGAHAAMMVHPAPFEAAEMPMIAMTRLDVAYTGKEAHASAFPELGVNAADALTVAQTSIGLLRQHLRPTDRVHGIVTKGGDAPNIVPAHTTGSFYARAATLEDLEDVRVKLRRCLEAGAIATGCSLEIVEEKPYAEVRHDAAIAAAYRRNAETLGRTFVEAGPDLQRLAASTDMGNVSLALPSIHPSIAIECLPAVNHQPEFAAKCATASADKAVVEGAIAMAWTAIDCATDDALRERLLTPEG